MNDFSQFLELLRPQTDDAAAQPKKTAPPAPEQKSIPVRPTAQPVRQPTRDAFFEQMTMTMPTEAAVTGMRTGEWQPGKVTAEQKKTKAEDLTRIIAGPADGRTKHFSARDAAKPAAVSPDATKNIPEAGKGNLLRAIAKSANEDGQSPGQLVMDGFTGNEPRQSDEKEIEEELRLVREKRIENFGFAPTVAQPVLTEEDEDPPVGNIPLPPLLLRFAEKFSKKKTPFAPLATEEYTHPDDRRRVVRAIVDARRNDLIRVGVSLVLGLILLLANIITTVSAANNNGFFAVFGGSNTAYAVFNLIFMIGAGVLLLPDFRNAFLSLLQLRARTEAALLGMYTVCIAQTISLFFTELQPEYSFHMFTGACVLLSSIYLLSKLFWHDNTRQCFRVAASGERKTVLRNVNNTSVLNTLLSEEQTGGVRAQFVTDTNGLSAFLARSADAARDSMPRAVLVPALTVAAFLCGIVAALVRGSLVCGISAVAAAACFSFPVCGLLACGSLMSKTNRRLSEKKCFIGSLRDARDFITTDHLAFDAQKILDAKIINAVSVDHVSEKAAINAAAVLAMHAGGILAQAFTDVLHTPEKNLPRAEDINIEEKLGISAWIENCRVLLGTMEMMVNHNIRPTEVPVTSPAQKNLYLAIEGAPVAAFTLEYSCKEKLVRPLREATLSGVNLLIRTNDPNLHAQAVQTLAKLPENSVKIVPKSGAELFDRLYNRVTEREDAGIVSANGFSGLCLCAEEAVAADRDSKTIGFICTAASVVGVCSALLLSITGGISRATAWSAVILQLLWVAAAFGIPNAKKLIGIVPQMLRRRPTAEAEETRGPVAEESLASLADALPEVSEEQLGFILQSGFDAPVTEKEEDFYTLS